MMGFIVFRIKPERNALIIAQLAVPEDLCSFSLCLKTYLTLLSLFSLGNTNSWLLIDLCSWIGSLMNIHEDFSKA